MNNLSEMDKSRAVDGRSRNTIRTDLSLLLECLKFQMKCPDLQKQALLTIHSICEKREDNVELLREMGGVAFLLNLSKSSIVQSDVKETALFTLGTVAEANVYCKNSLCKKEMFTDLAHWLVTEEAPLTKKRVTVYFLSVLVSNNKLGQTLAQNTACLDILLNLFRATFPLAAEGTFKQGNSTQLHQLWSSVSSALCGCVNNPQNEEGQRACVFVFPTVKNWIQQISLPQTEICQPICSFIAMTVAHNPCVQESFAASGGLENLTLALIRFCLGSETSLLSCQLAVSTSKTLSACISDNPALAAELAKYEVICHLFSLLINTKLESEERLSVLLTMGHCTEASEEHQKQLVQIGSLPVIITLLTEDGSEEVRKAATFILQTCKQATNTLGGPDVKERENENTISDTNIEMYQKSAEDILHRIDQLEKKQAEAERELARTQESTYYLSPQTEMAPEGEACESDDEPLIIRVNRKINSSKMKKSSVEDEANNAGGETPWWAVYNSTRALSTSNGQKLEGAREPLEKGQPFRIPVPPNAPRDSAEGDLRTEINDAGKEESISDVRCTGCVLRLDEVDSRTFWSLQSSCAHSCDMHRALKEATERYTAQRCSVFTQQEHPPGSTQELTNPSSDTDPTAQSHKNQREVSLTPRKKLSQVKRFQAAEQRVKAKVRLTPLHKGMKTAQPAFCQRTAPVFHRSHPSETKCKRKPFPDDPSDGNTETKAGSNFNSQRRKRQDFSREEELYLLCGVKTYGSSWNAILWSYPFQPGRTNVDLAHKYRRLMNNKAQGESV